MIHWTKPTDDWFDGVCRHCGVDIYDTRHEWADKDDESTCGDGEHFHEPEFVEVDD